MLRFTDLGRDNYTALVIDDEHSMMDFDRSNVFNLVCHQKGKRILIENCRYSREHLWEC